MDGETLLKDYTYYLRLERNMSPHTVDGYVSDVREALPSLGDDIAEVNTEDILGYLSQRADLSKRSQ